MSLVAKDCNIDRMRWFRERPEVILPGAASIEHNCALGTKIFLLGSPANRYWYIIIFQLKMRCERDEESKHYGVGFK